MTSPSDLTPDRVDRPELSADDDRVSYSPELEGNIIVLDSANDAEVAGRAERSNELAAPGDDELAAPGHELADSAGGNGAGALAGEETAGAQSDDFLRREQPGKTRQWHEIQAAFVDDPRGSVDLALQAVDDAVMSFVDGLRTRQAALAPDASPGDTERLRATVRSCRAFCDSLGRLREQLIQPD